MEGGPSMTSASRSRVLGAVVLWFLCWIVSFALLGLVLVDRGFIAFVWPVHELMASVFHWDPAGPALRISIAVFLGIIWAPLPYGMIKRRLELVAIPFCILFANWFSALLWGHMHAGL